ncbi:MAG: hypothetical protein SP1CHLAM54_00820 [Chlamydiia bacterium]|nr:hypothetical protein [Chlamydiia bacterium]MCH9615004.1 hypothetical protein [Chlamydiia bacterium]MCH9629946.1 hypothetical protein [Chlamydiia bacterium]
MSSSPLSSTGHNPYQHYPSDSDTESPSTFASDYTEDTLSSADDSDTSSPAFTISPTHLEIPVATPPAPASSSLSFSASHFGSTTRPDNLVRQAFSGREGFGHQPTKRMPRLKLRTRAIIDRPLRVLPTAVPFRWNTKPPSPPTAVTQNPGGSFISPRALNRVPPPRLPIRTLLSHLQSTTPIASTGATPAGGSPRPKRAASTGTTPSSV